MLAKHKPNVTLLLLAYRQEDYVKEALSACLNQEEIVLEIIASDDASNDRTYSVMEEVSNGYSGPHHLIIRRNEKNMGVIGHLNLLMSLATCEYIVVAAGDDISFPLRAANMLKMFEADKNIYAIYANAICITPDGERLNALYSAEEVTREINWKNLASAGTAHITGCGLAWRRSVFDRFGPLHEGLQAEDQIIPFRAALMGKVAYSPEPELYYRQSPDSLSYWRKYKKAFSGMKIEEMKRLHQKMTIKKLGDVSAMLHDLINMLPVGAVDEQISKLEERVNRLELDKFTLGNVGVMNLIQSNVFKEAKPSKKLMALLNNIFPAFYLIMKGLALLWRRRAIEDERA